MAQRLPLPNENPEKVEKYYVSVPSLKPTNYYQKQQPKTILWLNVVLQRP